MGVGNVWGGYVDEILLLLTTHGLFMVPNLWTWYDQLSSWFSGWVWWFLTICFLCNFHLRSSHNGKCIYAKAVLASTTMELSNGDYEIKEQDRFLPIANGKWSRVVMSKWKKRSEGIQKIQVLGIPRIESTWNCLKGIQDWHKVQRIGEFENIWSI